MTDVTAAYTDLDSSGLAPCDHEECKRAAIETYCGLRARGMCDKACFQAIVSIYLYSHPKVSPRDATAEVAGWLSEVRARPAVRPPW